MKSSHTFFFVDVAPTLFFDDSESCWEQISDGDYAYLTTSRNCPPACQWCDERGIHDPYCPYCDEPRELWEADLIANIPAELHEEIQHDLQREDN